MLYAMIGLGVLIIVLSIIFRVAAALRLSVPLLYALIAPTLFLDWYHENLPLAEGILYGLIGLAVLSWVFSFIRKVREWRYRRGADKLAEEIMLERIRQAKAEGRDTVSTEGLFREE